MRIVMPSGSNQVGTLLARAFHGEGHEVIVLSRHPRPALWRTEVWNPQRLDGWERHIDGADVVINDVNLSSAREFAEKLNAETVMAEIEAMGRRSLGVEADVSNKDAVDGMFEEILGKFGCIDILVNT